MGLPNKDEVKGTAEKMKGAVKQKAGQAIEDKELQNQGDAERAEGEVREQYGRARRKVGEAIKDMGKAVRK